DPAHVQQADTDDRVDVEIVQGLGSTFVQFNVTQPPFDDVDARRAACMAIDRESINEALNHGLNETAVDSLFPPVHAYNPGELEDAVDYDIDQAREMVSDLGGLEFTLNVSEAGVREAEAMQDQWREAGMDAEVQPLEVTAMIRQSEERTYDVAF